jgi:serine protease Do
MKKLSEIIKDIKQSVVAIGFTFPGARELTVENIAGTGFIFSEDGYVITCAHVITGKQGQLRVSIRGRGEYPHALSEVVLTDMERDIAIIKLPPPPLEKIGEIKFIPVKFGDSSFIEEGQEVAFCGFPFGGGTGGGFMPSTTKGIVSAIRHRKMGGGMVNHFQLDAMTMEGNSGAPLFDIETGDVIGIINARFDPLFNGNLPRIIIGGKALGISTNIGFAIPANLIKPIIKAVMEKSTN